MSYSNALKELNVVQFIDKKMFIHLQGGRKVSGSLRGYDLFLNLVIDDAVEETTPGQKHPIGTVVRVQPCFVLRDMRADTGTLQVIRGNSVTSMETLEAMRG